mmetsp:Transcript_100538/g.313352  ORF Transcript_100538/g.313352 Transcript_100538/m.313352 type:complete len:259 (-) Transcript_100538:1240-2016(-)
MRRSPPRGGFSMGALRTLGLTITSILGRSRQGNSCARTSQSSWQATGGASLPRRDCTAGFATSPLSSTATGSGSLHSSGDVSGFWSTRSSGTQSYKHRFHTWLKSRSCSATCPCSSTWSSTLQKGRWRTCRPTTSRSRSGCSPSWTSSSASCPVTRAARAAGTGWCSRSSRTPTSAVSRAECACTSVSRSWRTRAGRTAPALSGCRTCRSRRHASTRESVRFRAGSSSGSSPPPPPPLAEAHPAADHGWRAAGQSRWS